MKEKAECLVFLVERKYITREVFDRAIESLLAENINILPSKSK